MSSNLKEKIRAFVANNNEYPLLAGFTVGFYELVFYYSNNFELANSWQQFIAFTAYYVALPMAVSYLTYIFLVKSAVRKYARQGIFIVTLSFFAFYVLQNMALAYSYKRIFVVVFLLIAGFSFKVSNYKPAILFIGFMSVFPLIGIGRNIYANIVTQSDWNRQPDAIAECKFKSTPNIYFLQPDGYANGNTLRNPLYRFDNSAFDSWLAAQGFTLYDDFRSNYNSTLKSNASCFNLKHHYSRENTDFKNASDYILGKNPVLDAFRKNQYKTSFITERPYLLMSRPDIQFDYCNFPMSEVPYFQDGWAVFKDITSEVKSRILENKDSKHFFFIQKFDPGHITNRKTNSKGTAGERLAYLKKLKAANLWLTDIVQFINKHDPDAIIIIGADHAGFVGFGYAEQAFADIYDKNLLHSIFGAKLAIKWNSTRHSDYDSRLKTSVNLFRILFSFLSENPSYLNSLQPDVSYNNPDKNDLTKIYKAIESK